jgi:hypothetical protein
VEQNRIAWDATEMTAHYDAAAIATTQHCAATFDKRNRGSASA